jgi:hypothetical protein
MSIRASVLNRSMRPRRRSLTRGYIDDCGHDSHRPGRSVHSQILGDCSLPIHATADGHKHQQLLLVALAGLHKSALIWSGTTVAWSAIRILQATLRKELTAGWPPRTISSNGVRLAGIALRPRSRSPQALLAYTNVVRRFTTSD